MVKTLSPIIFKRDQLSSASQYLEVEGYVVIEDIYSEEELEGLENLFWEALESQNSKINRNDVTSWTNSHFPGEFSTGIMTYYGICQSDYLWSLRSNPIFLEIFGHFLGIATEELCCSMDGLNCMFSKKNKKKSWLHRDQVSNLEGGHLKSLQGIFNHYPVGECDGGFVICPKSHLETVDTSVKRHFQMLPEEDHHHENSYKLLIPGNSLIIFNSKLLHCNCSGSKDRLGLNGERILNRLSVYISYWPKKERSLKVLKEKQRLYLQGQGTSHWGIYAHKKPLKPRWPRPKTSDEIKLIKPRLSPEGNIPETRLYLM